MGRDHLSRLEDLAYTAAAILGLQGIIDVLTRAAKSV